MAALDFEIPEEQAADLSGDCKPNPDKIVIAGLGRWVNQRGKQLPQPCPVDFDECAQWWRGHMQEPERTGDTVRMSAAGGKQGWAEHYAIRLRTTLVAFLDLTDRQRQFIVAARQDGVFWRGDRLEIFQLIYEQTMEMRERWTVEDYRNECFRKMKSLDFSTPNVAGSRT